MIFHHDPSIELQLFHSRQQELEKRLEVARLIRDAQRSRSGFLARVRPWAGDFLIALGLMLKGQHESTPPSSSSRQPICWMAYE